MRILVIARDATAANILMKGLPGDQFVVDLASDGENGLRLAAKIDYDAVVLGSELPDADSVAKRLRESMPLPRTMFLGAHNGASELAVAFEPGAGELPEKSFSPEELQVKLHKLLIPAQERRHAPMDDLELARMLGSVTRRGKHTRLTPPEHATLEYLKKNAGRRVTPEMMTEKVMNLGFQGLTNVVSAYIKDLRAKVDHQLDLPAAPTPRTNGHLNGASNGGGHMQTE